jgi:hypothetical protein
MKHPNHHRPGVQVGNERPSPMASAVTAADTTTHGRLRRLIARDTSQVSRDFSAIGDGTGNAPTWEEVEEKAPQGIGRGAQGFAMKHHEILDGARVPENTSQRKPRRRRRS